MSVLLVGHGCIVVDFRRNLKMEPYLATMSIGRDCHTFVMFSVKYLEHHSH
jgi:hypothetical protein